MSTCMICFDELDEEKLFPISTECSVPHKVCLKCGTDYFTNKIDHAIAAFMFAEAVCQLPTCPMCRITIFPRHSKTFVISLITRILLESPEVKEMIGCENVDLEDSKKCDYALFINPNSNEFESIKTLYIAVKDVEGYNVSSLWDLVIESVKA